MKKTFLFLILSSLLVVGPCSYAQDTQTVENEIMVISEIPIQESNVKESTEVIVADLGSRKFVLIDNKFYTLKSDDGELLLSADWTGFAPLNEAGTKFKLTQKDRFFFLDTESGNSLMYPASDFTLLGEYLKIYKNNKYGLIDNYGNVILEPEYDRINVSKFNEEEFIVGKKDGKNLIYYNTGDIVPENELYTVSKDTTLSLLARDIKPIIKTNYLKSTYKKLEEEGKMSYKLEELNIEKNELSDKTITIKNKTYYVTSDEKKIGLSTLSNKRILPAEYDKISIKNLSGKFTTPVLLANKDGKYFIYNIKGDLLAEQLDNNKINVYKFKQVYTYQDGVIYKNSEKIGELIEENNTYKFEKTKFSILPMHRINELILTILSSKTI